MASQFSFDIVSDYDKSEINNVFDQAKREIDSRYDFKNTPAALEWISNDKNGIVITGNSDMQIDAIVDIIRKKLATRGLSQKLLDLSKEAVAANLKTTKQVPFIKGLDQDKAKKISGLIRDNYPKVKSQIQGESVRVTATSKDDLQAIISLLKTQDWPFAMQFTNYR